MRNTLLTTAFLGLTLIGLGQDVKEDSPVPRDSRKIQVLNLATFHMRPTPDENSVEFDNSDKEALMETRQISRLVAKFKPTVICVEIEPSENDKLNRAYNKFVTDSISDSSYAGEISLLAFEIGRLCKVDSIYGINHKMNYDYNINDKITNTLDPITFDAYNENPLLSAPNKVAQLNDMNTLNKLRTINEEDFLDFLIIENADMLTHVGTENNFEGADEAAKFYKRNLRMYSNLNRILMKKDDRVLIIMGGSHTAFFREFLKRSPKYQLVDIDEYLK
ncbi:DUF5694 domain-containing protein [uncultured Croceitalea sp.]|uniref:DUF5694 domain-containing protein n=1 Tax=uncultured Croceitalea sp. TaxID=1798908 RepID=UPI0033061532